MAQTMFIVNIGKSGSYFKDPILKIMQVIVISIKQSFPYHKKTYFK